MKSKPKVAVIVPCYNMAKYLSQCLDSVINQTLNDIEVICVDDGSTDETPAILAEYAARDSRITIISKKNAGVAAARNDAIRAARAEFICFMDPDDFYPTRDVLSAMYNGAHQHNVKVCGGEFAHFFEDTNTWNQDFCQNLDGYLFATDGGLDYREYQFDYGFHRFIFDREMLIRNNIFFAVYKRFEDPPVMVRAMITAGRFYALHKITYAYRCNHKRVVWDTQKAYDFLRGIIDNLTLAREYGLQRLANYTYDRFCGQMADIQNIHSPEVDTCMRTIRKMDKHKNRRQIYKILRKITIGAPHRYFKRRCMQFEI